LEALACGLPVVTTRFNGAGELMHDGEDGYLVDSPADRDALAQAMEKLLDADRRRAMGKAARAAAEAYPLQRNFREMMAVFQKAAARKEALQE
jgi:UDP-glucose:(heptosyl)LPS alpha-1,3-glucosyltransferase